MQILQKLSVWEKEAKEKAYNIFLSELRATLLSSWHNAHHPNPKGKRYIIPMHDAFPPDNLFMPLELCQRASCENEPELINHLFLRGQITLYLTFQKNIFLLNIVGVPEYKI